MSATGLSFADDRLSAASKFAHTMIVVDDEAKFGEDTTSIRSNDDQSNDAIETPTRKHAATSEGKGTEQDGEKKQRHPLNAQELIDAAMDKGLICSVLRSQNNDNRVSKISAASERADIVCLDWEIDDDDGETACKIIKEISERDAQKDGRLRLISIYTGWKYLSRILDTIFDSFSDLEKNKYGLKKEANSIIGAKGLKIICLFKTHGTKSSASLDISKLEVSIKTLPGRLLEEFASLSNGILSNIALATIASIRRVAHHTVMKYDGSMDGPFFFHRASLPNPIDANEYAVGVILSDLRTSIDQDRVTEQYASRSAIKRRLADYSNSRGNLTTKYFHKTPRSKKYITVKGSEDFFADLIMYGLEDQKEELKTVFDPVKKAHQRNLFPRFFSDSIRNAKRSLDKFSSMTSVKDHPGNIALRKPKLGLGSVVSDQSGCFYICVQPSCDSVRLKGKTSFIFAPLVQDSKFPDHVLPIFNSGKLSGYQGLSLKKKAYTRIISYEFYSSRSDGTKTVKAKINKDQGVHQFTSACGKTFKWIGDLKKRRSLRDAQNLASQMSRLGIDEFEPYRKNKD